MDDVTAQEIEEFCKVAAQLKFYMLALGWHGEPKASVIYGYVITDLEVVLLKRGVDEADTIYTSQPLSFAQLIALHKNPMIMESQV